MTTQTINSATASTPVKIQGKTLSPVLPGFLVSLSAGAVLTYNIEATGNTEEQLQSTWSWTPMTGFTGLSASIDGTLQALPTYIRMNITTYTSGTATFQTIQPNAK